MSEIWQTTRQAGVKCGGCGQMDTCTVAPDGNAFKCWRNGGEVIQMDGGRLNPTGRTRYGGSGARRAAAGSKVPRRPAAAYPIREAAIEATQEAIGRGAEFYGAWDYRDASGRHVMAVVRFDLEDGSKQFRPIHHTKEGWRIGDPPGLLPLYCLPDLPPKGTIYVTEGERAADAARLLGLPATTSAHGSSSASKTDWQPLAGRDIVILPDNDDAGRKYARDVESILAHLTPPARPKVVELPGLPPAGDIVEFVAERKGMTETEIRAQLGHLVQAVPWTDAEQVVGGPVLVNLGDVVAEPIEWLWEGKFGLGKLSVLAGDPGLGKSFVTLDMAARVTTGSPWPDGTPCPTGSVVLVNCEDGLADTIRPRLDRAGAAVAKVVALEGVRRVGDDGKLVERGFTLADVPALEAALRRLSDCKLVVIDPISAYLADTDSHNNAEIRGLLAPLAKLASKYGVAVVLVTHLNKAAGTRVMYRATGSIAFVAAARSAWVVVKDKDDDRRRLVLPVKNNLGDDQTGMAYSIIDGKVTWERDPVTIKADEALAPDRGGERTGKPGPAPSARTAAADWLREYLTGGPKPVAGIQKAAHEAGLSWSGAVRRAREQLGIKPYKGQFDDGWYWALPEGAQRQGQPLGPPATCSPSAEPAQVGLIVEQTAHRAAADSIPVPKVSEFDDMLSFPAGHVA